jgi:uncharacterized protein YecT (DUF1311 family)
MRSLLIGLMLAGLSAPAVAAQNPGNASACLLNGSTSFLRDLLFGAASRAPGAEQSTVTDLKRASSVYLVNARVLSYDAKSGRIECTGDVQLTVPAEAAKAFSGKTQMTTPVRFTAEPASDVNGFMIFSSRMALSADIAAASHILGPTRLSPIAAAATPETVAAAPPVRAADPHPAFDCALASTAVENLICSDSELAERDRRVSVRYFALRGSLPAKTRTMLLQSQRLFLKDRSQCGTSECLSALYDARLRRLDELEAKTAK